MQNLRFLKKEGVFWQLRTETENLLLLRTWEQADFAGTYKYLRMNTELNPGNRNYIVQAFLFTLAVAAILVLLTIFGKDREFFGIPLKPVEIFSDIRKEQPSPAEMALTADTLAEPPPSCPPGVECFLNFTGTEHPLDHLVSGLLKAKERKARVRIAWFGDSFSDGDILVSDLRDTLQSLYGGNGVGFVPLTSEIAGFRRSVIHSFAGWNTSSVLNSPGSERLGISGFGYMPDSGNYIFYKGSNHFRHTASFNTFRLFYSAGSDQEAYVTLNRKDKRVLDLPASDHPSMVTLHADTITQLRLNMGRGGSVCYGASLEDETGVYIDNFALKGNSGLGLLGIPKKNLAAFDSLLHYDLIVLQYGLNVSNTTLTDFSGYIKGMGKVISRLKEAFPNTPILLLSVSDRSQRRQGEFVTMPVIPKLIRAQETIAAQNKLLFWNLFNAMGGENSMAQFANSKPALANKDYTHLNFAGGRKIGLSLARSFVNEVDQYQKRRKTLALKN
jgi:lysophospholipase L1-like esterase